MTKNIENIILDLGNVVIDISESAVTEAYAKLVGSAEDMKKMSAKWVEEDLVFRYERGEISTDEFLDRTVAIGEGKCTREQSILAWNACLVHQPSARIDLIKSLRPQFKTFILSNTNELHEWDFNKRLKAASGHETFDSLVDKVFLSHRVGMRKPESRIYEHLLSDQNLNPERTLFIDDKQENLEAAAKFGIQTIQAIPGTRELKDIIASLSA